MEQVRVQPQREQPRLRCPRCGSLDTRFRYFNNYSNTQPRYLCRRCNRQWTVGGTLRHIPFGGRTRPGKKTKPSTSRSQLPQPPFPRVLISHEYLQNSHILRPQRLLIPQEFLRNSHILRPQRVLIPPNFYTTRIQQPTNISRVVSPLNLCYFNHDISCLDVAQPFLMQPQVMNHHANYGDQAFRGNANMEIPQVCNNQPMLSQDLPQRIPTQSGSYPTHGEGNNSPLCLTSLVHPPCLMSALPQDSTANADISASNALRKNHDGDSSNIESDTTPVDVDEWLDLSGYDSS